MKPSLFDAVRDGLREFFAILLAQRRSTRDDIDEVFDFPQVQFESRCLKESCTAAVGNDNPGSVSHGKPLSVIGRRLGAHRNSLRDTRKAASQRKSISNAHRSPTVGPPHAPARATDNRYTHARRRRRTWT